MDVAGFFTKWLRDVAADQYPSGSVPHVIPDVLGTPDEPAGGSAGWGDVAVIIPWTMYLLLRRHAIARRAVPEHEARGSSTSARAPGDDFIWDGDFHFGDWLAFATTRSDYPGATTGKDLIATAFFAHSTDLLAQAARVARQDRRCAASTTALLEHVEESVRRASTSRRRAASAKPRRRRTSLALEFNLLPEELRADGRRAPRRGGPRSRPSHDRLPRHAVSLSRADSLRLPDEAYLLLNREEYPSWLYPVTQGATTIWERWDGQKPDGTFQDKGMNSFNHYAYGAMGDWMYRVMAGIDIDAAAPGYKHIVIQPRPGGGFTSVKASHKSLYGEVASAWTRDGSTFTLTADVPANTHATIRLPGAKADAVTLDGKPLVTGNGVADIKQAGEDVVVETGSGHYLFAYTMPPAGSL